MAIAAPRFDLVVLAELNPDVIVAVGPQEVRFGQVDQFVDHATVTLGSSGAITASAAVAQGLRVAVCGVVGADVVGAVTLQLLAAQGIDTSYIVRRPGVATGMTIVLRRPDGDRAMLTFQGTMADLRASDVDLQLLLSARHVHVSSLFLQSALQAGLPHLLSAARNGGASTSLDPGWDPVEDWTAALPVLPTLDYLLPNRGELMAIAATQTGTIATDPVAAAGALAHCGPTVVVKDGPRGAYAVTANQALSVPAVPLPPTRLVDTTGAGDNFDGGFIAAILDDAPLGQATARGVASGTIAVTGHGGTGRHATREEARDAAQKLRVEHHSTTSAVPIRVGSCAEQEKP